MTPLQFVIRERMLKAQQLIRETSRSLIEIALEVGYTSPSHFAQVSCPVKQTIAPHISAIARTRMRRSSASAATRAETAGSDRREQESEEERGRQSRLLRSSDRTNTSYRRQINCCQGEFAGRSGTNVPVKEFQMLLG